MEHQLVQVEKRTGDIFALNSGQRALDYYSHTKEMSIMKKLEILSDAAKYDVSCSSSGVGRKGDGTGIGNTYDNKEEDMICLIISLIVMQLFSYSGLSRK